MGVPKVSPPGSSRSWTSLVKIIVAGTPYLYISKISHSENFQNKLTIRRTRKHLGGGRRRDLFIQAFWILFRYPLARCTFGSSSIIERKSMVELRAFGGGDCLDWADLKCVKIPEHAS
jgi:hypothetical protein